MQFISVMWCCLIVISVVFVLFWADPSTILIEIPCMTLPKITRNHCVGRAIAKTAVPVSRNFLFLIGTKKETEVDDGNKRTDLLQNLSSTT